MYRNLSTSTSNLAARMPSQAELGVVVHKVAGKAAKLAIVAFVCFWLSAVLYGVFYYTYMPKISFEVPAYIQYDPSCSNSLGSGKERSKTQCYYPQAEFALQHPKTGEDFFRVGQEYELVMEFEMPESELNQNTGIFMNKLSLISKEMVPTHVVQRSAALKYKSSLLKTLETFVFLPFLISGHKEECQKVSVYMGSYVPSPSNPVTQGLIELKSRDIAVYSAKFISHAKFQGIRYWLFYYPITVSFLSIFSIFTFLMFFVLANFVKTIAVARASDSLTTQPNTESNDEEDSENDEKQPQKSSTPETILAGDLTQERVISESQQQQPMKIIDKLSESSEDVYDKADSTLHESTADEDSFTVIQQK